MSTTWTNRGHFYVPHVTPVVVDCNFVVAATDSAGLGITSLKGQGVQNVFMHTSATPGRGSNGLLNPNPQSGIIMVQLADNFSRLYGQWSTLVAPGSGSDLAVTLAGAALTIGNIYQISVLGTTTAADWLALGVPPGVTPAVGVAFVALAVGVGVGSGKVQVPAAAASGVNHIEVIGKSQLSLAPIPVGGTPHVGGFIYLACYSDSASDANVITAPAAGTEIKLAFYLSQSSVVVAGE